jgi:hypothetical protein
MKGCPATSASGLGRPFVTASSRVPSPPARIAARLGRVTQEVELEGCANVYLRQPLANRGRWRWAEREA